MARRFRIRIDQQALRRKLERDDREHIPDAQLLCHLIDAGFHPDAGEWIVQEKDLGFLEPDEVLSIELVVNGFYKKE